MRVFTVSLLIMCLALSIFCCDSNENEGTESDCELMMSLIDKVPVVFSCIRKVDDPGDLTWITWIDTFVTVQFEWNCEDHSQEFDLHILQYRCSYSFDDPDFEGIGTFDVYTDIYITSSEKNAFGAFKILHGDQIQDICRLLAAIKTGSGIDIIEGMAMVQVWGTVNNGDTVTDSIEFPLVIEY